MVESASDFKKVYALRSTPWGEVFVAFDTYDEALSCFRSMTKRELDAKPADYIVKLPVFRGYWEVEQ